MKQLSSISIPIKYFGTRENTYSYGFICMPSHRTRTDAGSGWHRFFWGITPWFPYSWKLWELSLPRHRGDTWLNGNWYFLERLRNHWQVYLLRFYMCFFGRERQWVWVMKGFQVNQIISMSEGELHLQARKAWRHFIVMINLSPTGGYSYAIWEMLLLDVYVLFTIIMMVL